MTTQNDDNSDNRKPDDNQTSQTPQSKIINAYHYTLIATGFLSRLPVHHFKLPKKMIGFDKTAPYFPLAGVLIALPSIIILCLADYFGLPVMLSAALTLTAMIATTGALHEDGLADVFDGFGGGKDKARKLEIMHDSRLGTYGTLALLCVYAIKLSALYHLLGHQSLMASIGQWIAVAALSRAAMVYLWQKLPPALDEGLSVNLGVPNAKDALAAIAIALIVGFIGFSFGSGLSALMTLICVIIISAVMLEIYAKICISHIGGHTGDVLGSSQQFMEVILLVILCASL